MPFRDTPRERRFAEKSIPSAIELDPDELVVGVDAPADDSLMRLIRGICDMRSFKNLRIVQVERSPDWRFQLANIIWHCYKASRNDTILAFDVDSVLRLGVLAGRDMVGVDNIAVVSFTKKLLVRSLGDLLKYASYRWRVRTSPYVFAGIYWIHRPYYMQDIPLDGLQKIRNGIDTYMIERIFELERHRIVTLKDIGVDCMDYQNEDYPWRQFQDGVWYYANRNEFRRQRRERMLLTGATSARGYLSKIIDRDPKLFVLIKTIAYQHWWMLRGYLWASRNRTHAAVQRAHGLTFEEWNLEGSTYIKEIHDWKKQGRTGTGFG